MVILELHHCTLATACVQRLFRFLAPAAKARQLATCNGTPSYHMCAPQALFGGHVATPDIYDGAGEVPSTARPPSNLPTSAVKSFFMVCTVPLAFEWQSHLAQCCVNVQTLAADAGWRRVYSQLVLSIARLCPSLRQSNMSMLEPSSWGHCTGSAAAQHLCSASLVDSMIRRQPLGHTIASFCGCRLWSPSLAMRRSSWQR
jgi:hypothetical protein